MKKAIAVALSLGLLGGALVAPAEAGKKKKPKKVTRTVESKYEAPAIGFAGPNGGSGVCFRPTNSCGDIAVGSTEKYVTIEIVDATGTAVAFDLGQDTNPDEFGTEGDLGSFCGKTEVPVKLIEPGLPIVVFPWAFGGSQCPGAFGTQGTVKATLSNLP